MTESRFDTAAVVLGMHRSGTSALAGALGLVGFAAPRTLLPSSAVNERGFWESQRVKDLNDEVFVELGTTWHGLVPLGPSILSEPRFDFARERAADIVTDEFDAGTRPVIKDPRLCRLMALWQPALTSLAARTVHALALRNPLEVAQSLARRNDFSTEQGLLLWARYYLDAEYESRGAVRSFVSYANLLDDPAGTLDRLATELQLDFPMVDETQLADFLTKDLRHHRIPDEAVFGQLEKLPGVAGCYRVMLGWGSRLQETKEDHQLLDRIRGELDQSGAFLSDVFENSRLERKRLAAAKSHADEARSELDGAHRTIENLGGLRETLEQRLGQLETKVDETASRAQAKAAEDRESIQRLERIIDTLETQVRGRAALDKALAVTLDQVERLKKDGRALEKQREDVSRQLRAIEEDLGRTRAEHKASRDQVKTLIRKYRSTQEIVEHERAKIRDLRGRLGVAESTLAQYRKSLPWQVYVRGRKLAYKPKWAVQRLLGNSAEKRRQQTLAAVEGSALFDAAWYVERYPDVASSGIDPATHYLEYGWREGRDPGPGFSTSAYLKANADVAARGVNPLLHYVEYGHSEGRGTPEHAAPSVKPRPREDFGPAAPIVTFPVEPSPVTRWLRSAQLDTARGSTLMAGGYAVGLASAAAKSSAFEAALSRLAGLSGSSRAIIPAADVGEAAVLDAWHVGGGRLRTRWRVGGRDAAFVVRVLEQGPSGDPRMIGEGLIESELDTVDAKPSNPLFPLLFVFAEAEGQLLGWRTLAFPSLCRGGLHYAELVALAQDSELSGGVTDSCELGSVLAGRLFSLRSGTSPVISAIEADLRHADGTHPLFQSEFKAWLASVMGVPIRAKNDRNATCAYLADAVKVDAETTRPNTGATLVLAHDMIPSISILVAENQEGASDEVVASLISVGSDPPQHSTLIRIPVSEGKAVDPPLPWLRNEHGLRSSPGIACVTALRMPPSRALGDAELLVPIAAPELDLPDSIPAISWLIWPDAWEEPDLLQALESMAAQVGAATFGIAFVGRPQAAALDLAQVLFDRRVRAFDTLEEAADAIETPLIAYIGPSVILHDVRTAAILAKMLDDPAVATASPVLLSVDKRGKAWLITPADAGAIPDRHNVCRSTTAQAADSLLMWRSTWSSMLPPRDLWLARKELLKDRRREGELVGQHQCTTLVTASYCSPRSSSDAPLFPPPAREDRALMTEVLVG